MGTFRIEKSLTGNFYHVYNNENTRVNVSDFDVVIDAIANTFIIQCKNGSNIPNQAIGINNIEVVDLTQGTSPISFSGTDGLIELLKSIDYTPYLATQNIVDPIVIYKKGQVAIFKCTQEWIDENFNETGLGINEATGWAKRNGQNETANQSGKFSLNQGSNPYQVIGATGGEAQHILTIGELPQLSATVLTTGGGVGGSDNDPARGTGGENVVNYPITFNQPQYGQPHNNMPPYLIDLWVERVTDLIFYGGTAGGGGGTQDLQSVTDEGNITNNNIILIGTAGLLFDNGSKVKKGTTDAGYGGNKGIALKCSIDYELKWEAGRLFVMEQDAFIIRESHHNFDNIPDVNQDETKGFVVGSFWVLDNGVRYQCTDASTGAAVWVLYNSPYSGLPETLAVNNHTNDIPILSNDETTQMTIGDSGNFAIQTSYNGLKTFYLAEDAYIFDSNLRFVFDGKGIDMNTSSDGLGIPRVTNTAMNAIAYPTNGMLVWNSTFGKTYQYNGSSWVVFGDTATPTLQQVADEGNETTTPLKVIDTGAKSILIQPGNFIFDDLENIGQTSLTFSPSSTTNEVFIKAESGTLALLSDIPTSSGIPHATAAGTDTYTATITGVVAYADGDAYLIRFTNGNTAGCTLNINALGAKTLYRNNDGVLIGGDIQAGAEMLCVYNSTLNAFQCIGTAPNTLLAYVTNDDTVTLTKGMAVYAFSGTGDRMTVKRASNTSDGSSAQTIGLVLSSSIAANQKGIIITQGLLDGLSILPTSTWNDGDAVYLGATAGTITNVKPSAPNHLVYLGIVTTASNGSAGRMYVKVQNGYELQELHNVQAQSPSLKDTLWYDSGVSPGQWKTASIPTILGYTPEDAANKQTDLTASSTKYPTVNAVNTGLSTKENTITAGTTAQYWRGDKSWQTLDKTAVGLGNVDNTSDANKPISTATQTALNLKQNTATLIADSVDKAILRNSYFWFLPNTVTAGQAASFAMSERIGGSSFALSGNGNLTRSMTAFNTNTTPGNIAFLRQNNALQLQGYEVVFTRKIQFNSNVSGQRFFCGISKGNQFSPPTNVDQTTLTDIVGVAQLSTSTNMHVIHNDSSGTATTIDLGSSYPCNDSQYNYYITIEQTTTSYIVTVERVTISTGASISTVNTLSSNIPNYNTGVIQLLTWITNNAQSSVASYLDGGAIGYLKNL